MKAFVVHESYKATTGFNSVPVEIEEVRVSQNSFGACQLLFHDGRKNHFILGKEFSIADAIEIPLYRIEIQSDLPVKAQFVEYYYGNQDIVFADKLIDQTNRTYSGDRFAPLYVEFPISEDITAGDYPVTIKLFRSQLTEKDQLVLTKTLKVTVNDHAFPADPAKAFNLNFWQQPSNLARSFDVPLWSEEHFRLLGEMASSLAAIGQKAVTVIAGEIPWKGWFNYIVKDYPANLYEYSMIRVKKTIAGQLTCDFSILDRYLDCMFAAGVDQEIDVFGLLGVWQPPFFPLVKALEHPEKLVIRYYNEAEETMDFIQQKVDLQEYLSQVFAHFKALGVWDKVRIVSDEPKVHEIATFNASLAELKAIDETIQIKVAFDKEDVLQQLLPQIDYPVTSYYCTCNNYEALNQSHSGKTQYYVCNYPDKPNTFLHSPLLETRLQGLLAHHFKTNGMLRWAYNCWPENAREDIRYNTSSLPIGDLCFIYPSNSGHLLLSLRYKQLQRGIEDFYLIKQAEAIMPEQTAQLINDFLVVTDPKEWMLDSHTSNPAVFHQTFSDYERFRQSLLAIVQTGK
jgi:hypothetical protein